MDDFAYVLVAALVVLMFVFVLSSLGPWIAPGGSSLQVFNFSVGRVGVATDVPTRTDSFGSFVVGEAQYDELRSVPQLSVSASWLGSTVQKYSVDVPEWFLEDIRGVRISFNVYDTNKYGALVVTWNGLRVSGELMDRGSHVIEVKSEHVKESNTLQVYAEGPGPLFWASTAYVLRDFRVEVEYGPSKLVPFQTLRSELETFSRGEVTFYALDAKNTLTIKVNGVSVYEQMPQGQGSAQFDFVKVPLNAGTNIISFGGAGRVELRDVALNLFLLTNEVVRVRSFNLTNEQYALLTQGYGGKVTYTVDDILRSGNLNIGLNDRITRVSDVSVGEDSIRFDKDDVHAGENEISFSGTGGFALAEAAISIGPGF